MSRLSDLIAQAKAKDLDFGADLEREFKALSSRLPFGLNFERHRPEAVELPQRVIRRGDKVRVLPERGSTKKGDPSLWLVEKVDKARRQAKLVPLDAAKSSSESRASSAEPRIVSLGDLVVVAEFRDTIYPGLVSTGEVSRGGDKPCHTVINGENYHVLKALTWTHRGRVDAIYIDPPYNTGAKDWKYNNDYVEDDDLYRHSKWLAMMERRLLVARELLNPLDSVLIVTIDEKEYLRLGLLLEQAFPEANINMVTTVISPAGTQRVGEFSRTNEYVYFCRMGAAVVLPDLAQTNAKVRDVVWDSFQRHDLASRRGAPKGGKAQFYPIFIEPSTGRIKGVGEALPHDVARSAVPTKDGCATVFPVRPDGTEMNWCLTAPAFLERLKRGYIRVGRYDATRPQPFPIYYLLSGTVRDIEEGRAVVKGRRADGSVEATYVDVQRQMPTTTWVRDSHNARVGGTELLKMLLSGRRFPFPKSLYAVEDALRLFVEGKPEALVLDYFSGSGTTAHAVMRLNKQDGGKRQCISVTNNEVGADEQKALREKGLRPGDAEWERLGICDYITKPRVQAAISGKTPDGEPIQGDYKFTDEFPMAEGFVENAEFFTLTYETPNGVRYDTAFACIAPLLWLRAGSRGRRIDKLPAAGWDVADTYGLLVDLDSARDFLKATRKAKDLRVAYIVTDDERRFQALARRLRAGVEAVRLYESYLTNFGFASGE